MTTLKQARKEGKLDKFIKEHAKDDSGDKIALDKAIKSMAEKSKSVQRTSSRDDHDD